MLEYLESWQAKMKCPECKGDVRRILHVVVELPFTETAITKKIMRKADVKILGAERATH